jgi:hypothetical protein
VRRGRSRLAHLYVLKQLLGSLMRHLRGLTSIEIALLARGVMCPTGSSPLVARTGSTK